MSDSCEGEDDPETQPLRWPDSPLADVGRDTASFVFFSRRHLLRLVASAMLFGSGTTIALALARARHRSAAGHLAAARQRGVGLFELPNLQLPQVTLPAPPALLAQPQPAAAATGIASVTESPIGTVAPYSAPSPAPTGPNSEYQIPPGVPIPPDTLAALVLQAGDANAPQRANKDGSLRKDVVNIFKSTHLDADFGAITLSPNAQSLREAFRQQQFSAMTLYHGTKKDAIPWILNGGFMYGYNHWHGAGIYAAESLARAECYGNVVLQLEVYFSASDQERYIRRAQRGAHAGSTLIISDPLLIFPISLMRANAVEPNCM